MIQRKILEAKQDFFNKNRVYPTVVVMNYDTALMALSTDLGGERVCFYLSESETVCDMRLVISGKLKNEEIIVGGEELIEKFKES